MASAAISATTALLAGATMDAGVTASSADTITITAPSGANGLDLSRLAIILTCPAGSTASFYVQVGSSYTSIGQGEPAKITLTSSTTVVIGGRDFESARFLQLSAQSVVLRQSNAGAIGVTAALLPYSFTG
jgi:Fe2+ transport system protein FeoA